MLIATNDIGGTELNIEVCFSTESVSCDWLAIYLSGVIPNTYNYNEATISNGKLGGGKYTVQPYNNSYHKTYTVSCDTAQFCIR